MAPDTRERLLRSTYRLLRRQGYGATGLNQVVAEADAPKGSMYFHFPGGKEELAAAAIDQFAERATAALERLLAESPSVADAVGTIFDADLARLERTEFVEGCPVATVALDAAATHDALAGSVGRAFDGWIAPLAAALEAEGHPAEDAHALAVTVYAGFEGAIVLAKAQRSLEPMAVVRDQLRTLLAPPASSIT
jgi:TetR/AcrR family transcriptional repressor of lmrAB and yxaGH operons